MAHITAILRFSHRVVSSFLQAVAGTSNYLFAAVLLLDKDSTLAYVPCIHVHARLGASVEMSEHTAGNCRRF